MEAGATVTASNQGYGRQAGSGSATNDRAGGSHGGRGGGREPAAPYGSALRPAELGSGGWEGAGGGRIKLEVAGRLRVEGAISANGATGGGAGGSIWIEAGAVEGQGLLQANGGGGQCPGCSGSIPGGGGGRIAVYHAGSTFSGLVEAFGGRDNWGNISGEDGTVGWFDVSDPTRVVFTAGHGWRFQTNDAVDGEITLGAIHLIDSVVTVEEGITRVRAETEFSMIQTTNTAVCSLRPYERAGTLDVAAETMNLGAGCIVSVDSKGYGPGAGPGASGQWTGAGHGGRGGESFGPGGPTYGSERLPTEWGSSSVDPGGQGGGALSLTVGDLLVLDGTLSANARRGDGGGSSGGSILVRARRMASEGALQADGAQGG